MEKKLSRVGGVFSPWAPGRKKLERLTTFARGLSAGRPFYGPPRRGVKAPPYVIATGYQGCFIPPPPRGWSEGYTTLPSP
jgi:hypothetical protein